MASNKVRIPITECILFVMEIRTLGIFIFLSIELEVFSFGDGLED